MGSAPSQSRPASATASEPATNPTSKLESGAVSGQSYQDRGLVEPMPPVTIMPKRKYSPELLAERMEWRNDLTEIINVTISKAGFSKTSINIVTGNVVRFTWDISRTDEVRNSEATSTGFNVTQVVHDGEQFRPVPGGIHSGQLTPKGEFSHRFGIEGQFNFVSSGIRCSPLTVRVTRRPSLTIEFDNNCGFSIGHVDLEVGESVTWVWNNLSARIRVAPATLCVLCGFAKLKPTQSDASGASEVLSSDGSLERHFDHSGIYYFVTLSDSPSYNGHLCIVRVRDFYREHRIRISDEGFEPSISTIGAGDRVWFEWGGGIELADSCQFRHAPFELSVDDSRSELKPVQGGYRWLRASRSGLMAHDFLTPFDGPCSVGHFADMAASATAGKLRRRTSKIGSIIVQKKPTPLTVRVDKSGRFSPDFVTLSVGDSLVLERDEPSELLGSLRLAGGMSLPDGCKQWVPAFDVNRERCHDCVPLSEAATKQILDSKFVFMDSLSCSESPGVRHFVWEGQKNGSVLSVLSEPRKSQIHSVNLTDSGNFEPADVTVAPDSADFLLCRWQSGRRLVRFVDPMDLAKNRQLFASTMSSMSRRQIAIDGPCALLFQCGWQGCRRRLDLINDTGCYLRVHRQQSAGSGPRIVPIDLTSNDASSTTVLANIGDLAVWMFSTASEAAEQLQLKTDDSETFGRRIVEQLLNQFGLLKVGNASIFAANHVEDLESLHPDATIVSVSTKGQIRPSLLTVARGDSVMWCLLDEPSKDAAVLNLTSVDCYGNEFVDDRIKIEKLNRDQSRCRFSTCGIYRFSVSPGGQTCCVIALWHPDTTPTPQLVMTSSSKTNTGFIFEPQNQPVDVYYTTDGSFPWPHKDTVQVCATGKTIQPATLSSQQIVCIRALALSRDQLPSTLLTTFFEVDLAKPAENVPKHHEEDEQTELAVIAPLGNLPSEWFWYNLTPTIQLVQVADGTIEIFWNQLSNLTSCQDDEENLMNARSIKTVYRLFVNGAVWATGLPSNCCYRIGGLAAGADYTIRVDAAVEYSSDDDRQIGRYPDLRSNELRYNSPSQSSERGPLISLEQLADSPESVAVVWAALSVSHSSALIGYKVSLNGLQCGRLVTPEADGQRCRVIIEACEMNKRHSLMVYAVWADQLGETFELPSNRLQFRLPLPRPLAASAERSNCESLLLVEGACEHEKLLAAALAEEAAAIADASGNSEEKLQDQLDKDQSVDDSKSNKDDKQKKESKQKEVTKHKKKQQRNKAKQGKAAEELEAKNSSKILDSRRASKKTTDKFVPINLDQERKDSIPEGEISSETDLALPGAAVLLLPAPLTQKQQSTESRPSSHTADKSLPNPPSPKVRLEPIGPDRVRVLWQFDNDESSIVGTRWKLLRSTVSVAGRRFGLEDPDELVAMETVEQAGGIRRSWSCGPLVREAACGGLAPGCDYVIHVISAFVDTEASQSANSEERISRSAAVVFIAGEAAKAATSVESKPGKQQKVQMLTTSKKSPPREIPRPRLYAVSSGVNRVAVRWTFDEEAAATLADGGFELAGYQLLINGTRRGGLLPSQTSQTTLEPLRPGRSIRVAVQAAAFVQDEGHQHDADDDFQLGPASATLRVNCPRRPLAPNPSVSPAAVSGASAATVSWSGAPEGADVSRYRVYVDGQWHGDIKASPGRNNYYYYLSDLQPGIGCEAQVKAIAGSDEVDPQSDSVTCLCESELSQPPLRVTGAVVTQSPELSLEATDSDGLTLAWDALPPESGVCGYQILRDGQPYGQPIPPGQRRFRVEDLPAGGRLSLQLVAMTTGAERCAPGPVLLVNCAVGNSDRGVGGPQIRRGSPSSRPGSGNPRPFGVTFRPTTAAIKQKRLSGF